MIKNLKAQKSPDRDGTPQEGRRQQALSPDYVAIDDRSIEALIASAQRLAKTLRFEGENVVNWEAFLLDEITEYRKKTDQQQASQRRRWAKELAAYLRNPDSINHDPQKKAVLGKPHVALFLTFMRLLDYLKRPLNGLVKKKLDFYYRKRLGLALKKAVPDVVHVLVALAGDTESHPLKKGTLLQAGKDGAGHDLLYATDYDSVISTAQIADLKTIFLEKKSITLKQMVHDYSDHPQEAIKGMMELALGDPKPGDPLPAFPQGITNIRDLNEQVKAGNLAAISYVSEELCLTGSDFLFITKVSQKHTASQPVPDPDWWKTICRILESAYRARVKKKARRALMAIHRGDEQNGFDNLLSHVYGRSELDGMMPEYKGKEPSLFNIYNDLTNAGNFPPKQAGINHSEALDYIRNELFLSEKSFVQLVEAYRNPKTLDHQQWEQLYVWLEASKRKVKEQVIPLPKAEKWLGVYAEPDTKATAFSRVSGDQELLQFRAFGGRTPHQKSVWQPATIGWAIRSPMLLLAEGKREITITISLQCDKIVWNTLQKWADAEQTVSPPFQIELTTEEGWIQPANTKISFGNFLLGRAEMEYPEKPTDTPFPRQDLVVSDEGKYLVQAGALYRIEKSTMAPVTERQMELAPFGAVDPDNKRDNVWKKYAADQVYIQALQVRVTLDEEDLPITPFVSEIQQNAFTSQCPALSLTVNQTLQDDSARHENYYQHFVGVTMERVHLNVQAEGLQELLLQNDNTDLDTKKPFCPFGDAPALGDSLYLAHPEITQKRLDNLTIDWEWMNAPEDFKAYYKNYWLAASGSMDLDEKDFRIKGNEDFQLMAYLHEGRASGLLSHVALFPKDGKVTIDMIAQKKNQKGSQPPYIKMPDGGRKSEVLDWDRYFKFELTGNDFQHERYPQILAQQASFVQQNIANQLKQNMASQLNTETTEELVFPPANPTAELILEPPYTPKLKRMAVGYSAHEEVIFGQGDQTCDQIIHLHPFGYKRVDETERVSLFPVYDEEGALFLGIENLARPQLLSLLFQMAEGSADPDSEKPEVQWSYLEGDSWVSLEKAAILTDTTNGLLNTGIVRLKIPEGQGDAHTVMPGERDWLKISCLDHRQGVPDILGIHTQAVSATLRTTDASAEHFADLLAPGSISGVVEPIPALKEIVQPYASVKGRPHEDDASFYTRVSERLRHKNRALTVWDYEHLILERFPAVRKVKCVQGDILGDKQEVGIVSVIAIADIRSKMPNNPFEPKLSLAIINQIQNYLERWAPAYTTIKVFNPVFLQVKVQMAVKFREGYDPGYYTRQLEQDLKHFLSPWAYEGDSNITLGGKMYASSLVNFIMKKPYIAFLGRVGLLQSEDGENFVAARIASGASGLIKAYRPDMAIVSAQSHDIRLLTEEDLRDEDATGISHMIIEQDLMLQKKPGTGSAPNRGGAADQQQPEENAPGISKQAVGVNLKVGRNPSSADV